MTSKRRGKRTQHVVFVLLPHTLLLDLAGPAEALRLASKLGIVDAAGHAVDFAMRFVGPSAEVPTSIGLTLPGIEPLPESLPQDAIIVVIGVMTVSDRADRATVERAEVVVAKWLRSAAAERRVLTVCSGALVAARAGLLDGKKCTTHHSLCAELQKLAPTATVLENRLFVSDGKVSTSAGITAGIDLTLRLIAELGGDRAASAVARDMVVYMRRAGADPQLSPWTEGRAHLHPALHRVQDAIAADPAHTWTVRRMAAIAHCSERHLTRLFVRQVGVGPMDYLHRLRIAIARELLAASDFSMDIVAERSGFSSARHLRRIWHKFEATPPSHARQGTRPLMQRG